jgi:hypothetical protein
VAGQARVHGGQGREAGQGTIGLADRDGPVELHDRALGEPEQLVVPADDLHPVGLLGARRVGVQGGDTAKSARLDECFLLITEGISSLSSSSSIT